MKLTVLGAIYWRQLEWSAQCTWRGVEQRALLPVKTATSKCHNSNTVTDFDNCLRDYIHYIGLTLMSPPFFKWCTCIILPICLNFYLPLFVVPVPLELRYFLHKFVPLSTEFTLGVSRTGHRTNRIELIASRTTLFWGKFLLPFVHTRFSGTECIMSAGMMPSCIVRY